ncbi:PAS domain-containing protein [Kovacikia minuta CCNUW1]|uniref:PAS domain-containing protein n=1 Tax=Kovacikia minuta TaxID=2931930 RepID=UPI001CCC300E|nr:PAS domain-containing protein [Kovacikia minuta]UBF28655.1 PAS domain-containing protein [Kovacikia minuta CCNUW1]
MNSGKSTAGSGFGDVPNQPSPIESSQSQVNTTNSPLGSADRPSQAFFEAAIDAICHVNASIASFRVFPNREWHHDYRSTGTQAVFGFTAEEFITDKSLWLTRVHPVDQEAVLTCFEQALTDGVTTVEYRYYHRDGSLRWISDTFTSRWVEPDNCWIVTVMGIDITDRKQTEIALQESKERYTFAVQAGQVGVWEWDVQTNGVHIDPQLKTMLGFAENEISDEIDVWRRLIHPDDLERVTGAMADYLAGQSSEYALEHRMLHRDGSIRWFLTQGVAFRTADGQPYRIVGTRTDITERKRLTLALQASEAKLNNILDNAIAAIASFRVFADRSWEHDYFSPGFEPIFGYTPQELMADKFLWTSRVLPEDWDTNIMPLFEDFFAERPVKAEYRFFRQDGAVRWISSYFTSLRDAASDCWIVTVVSTDISDRKQAEEALKRQAVWEQVLRTISQRIRQSLDLEQILSTAVTEIHRLLQADRVLILRLYPSGVGQVIKEAVVPEYPVTDEMRRVDEFSSECYEQYRQGQPYIVPNGAIDTRAACVADFMPEVGVRSKMVAPITHHPENAAIEVWGLLIVHACSYQRRWQGMEAEFLQQVSNQLAIAIQQADFYQQLQTELAEHKQTESAMQQAMEREQQIRERERFIATIAQNIRQSLNFNNILNTTVAEVRQFLEVDRVLIYCFNPDWSGQIVAESVQQDSYSIIRESIDDPCFQEAVHHPYQQGRIHAVNDVLTADLHPCYVQFLTRLQVRAVLVVPILVQQDLWGLLIAHQCTEPREWQQVSWYLLRQLSTQLAIGIHQSELYSQVQQLNANLENQVQERTVELQRSLEFEALLKRITDHVRDSLDEGQILQTVVRELACGLSLKGCDVALNDIKRQVSVIRYEHISEDIPSAQGREVPIDHADGVLNQLLQGKTFQFCRIVPDPTRPFERQFTVLGCPIIDSQTVLGDLWLFRHCEATFSEPEIRLVQQVANQCAIAIRQARLYETAQTQVIELGRLNQLKDDFLSTVSHELRTPISSIKMATQMLEIILFNSSQDNRQDELNSASLTLDSASLQRLRRYFQILRDESEREIDLINNLLDLTRLDDETDPLLTNTIHLEIWLPHVAEPFVERITNHEQQLQFDLAPNLPALNTDLTCLQRILSELLTNACKYTPAGETIRVSARLVKNAGGEGEDTETGGHGDAETLIQHSKFGSADSPEANIQNSPHPSLLICVSNTGVEIPSHELSQIFDKFYRIPNNDPWKYGGTGLGLALVQKLVNRLGATIWVESTGGQTTFTLQFSIANQNLGTRE